MDDLQGGLKDNLPGNRLGENIDRREFIRRLALVTGGVVVAQLCWGTLGAAPRLPPLLPPLLPRWFLLRIPG